MMTVERVKGIEPSYAAWEAAVLPLNYTRARYHRESNISALPAPGQAFCLEQEWTLR